MKRNGIVALVVGACVLGCGAEERSAPAVNAGSATPNTPTPTATQAAPAAPAAIGACTVGPSIRIARERRRPKVVVGRDHVAIVHASRRAPSLEGTACDPARIIHTSPLPMSESSFTALPSTSPCIPDPWGEGGLVWAPTAAILVDAERDGGDVYTMQCDAVDAGNENTGEGDFGPGRCTLAPVGGRGATGMIPVPATYQDFALVRSGFQIAHAGPFTVFAVALANTEDDDGVYALVGKDGRTTPSRRLGRPPTAVDLDDPAHFVMSATPAPDGGFVFDHGAATTPRRVRTTFGPDGAVHGVPTPTTLESVPPPDVDLATDRSVRNAPSTIRIHRQGVMAPIGGFPSELATFAPRFVRRDGRLVAVWSEGTGTTTRIRMAIIDVANAAIVGPIVDVSSAGIEAGYATIDGFEDSIVVAWDEKLADGWDVRAAPVTCR